MSVANHANALIDLDSWLRHMLLEVEMSTFLIRRILTLDIF
jgi:hypothetical protein